MSSTRLSSYTIAFILAFLGYFLLASNISLPLEHMMLDNFFSIRGPIPTNDDTAVILIDATSFSEMEISPLQPWPRSLTAKLLERLRLHGVKAVVIDMVFPGKTNDDALLAESMRKIPTVFAETVRTLERSDLQETLFATELLRDAAFDVGEVFFLHGKDRIAHQFPIGRVSEGALVETIPFLAMKAIGLEPPFRSSDQNYSRYYLNYYAPTAPFETFSASTVLNASPHTLSRLKGKTVFIGIGISVDIASLSAHKDMWNTPFGSQTFGVFVQATAFHNLKNKEYLSRLSEGKESLILNLVVFIGLVAILLLRPPTNSLVTVSLVSGLLLTSYLWFLDGIFFPVTTSATLLTCAGLLDGFREFFIERRERLHLKQNFSRYLDSRMVDQIAAGKSSVALGGNLRPCALFFSDIASFTTLSESMSPGEVSKMLNEYFTEVGELITSREGTLVQFLGDGVFSLWNAPIEIDQECEKALTVAKTLSQHFHSESPPEWYLPTRTGLHYADVVVGNLGSFSRFDYTAVGDGVNLASRLEGLCKKFDVSVLMSEAFRKRLRDHSATFFIGLVKVAGKSKPVAVYSIRNSDIDERDYRTLATIIESIQQKELSVRDSLKTLTTEKTFPFKKIAQCYLDEINAYLAENTELSAWDTILTFSSK